MRDPDKAVCGAQTVIPTPYPETPAQPVTREFSAAQQRMFGFPDVMRGQLALEGDTP